MWQEMKNDDSQKKQTHPSKTHHSLSLLTWTAASIKEKKLDWISKFEKASAKLMQGTSPVF